MRAKQGQPERDKYKPYIRRSNGREKSESFRIAMRLAFYKLRGRPFYVMVQRGFPNNAVEVGPSRAAIIKGLVAVVMGWSYRRWQQVIKRKSQGRE